MPKLTIEQSHSLDHPEVKKRLEEVQTKLATKYGIESSWTSDTEAKVKRTGASGTIKCHPGKVTVELDLSFALSPIKGTVESRIKEELARALGKDKA